MTAADAERATALPAATLDAGFFRVRYDRYTPRQRDHLRAMARLGPGPPRSGDNAGGGVGRGAPAVAPLRNRLVAKGMTYGTAHGDTAFTVPMFDAFLNRTVPPDEAG